VGHLITSTNLEVIELLMCCASLCYAAADHDLGKLAYYDMDYNCRAVLCVRLWMLVTNAKVTLSSWIVVLYFDLSSLDEI
jgi:hypothetical protein